MPPDAVVFAHSTEEVAAVVESVRAPSRAADSVTASARSLEGHVLAMQGGVASICRSMNQVLEVNPTISTSRCRPASRASSSTRHLRDTGFFFPIDPGADATIGGMAATGASGTNAVRYGTMRDNVWALTVVTARRSHSHRAPREKVQRGL